MQIENLKKKRKKNPINNNNNNKTHKNAKIQVCAFSSVSLKFQNFGVLFLEEKSTKMAIFFRT